MAEKKTQKEETLLFKGRPLVRSGDTIYYGHPGDRYVALLKILGNENFQDMDLATKVTVQIMSTDPEARIRDRILKKTEKNGLYNALNIASIWLERALSESK